MMHAKENAPGQGGDMQQPSKVQRYCSQNLPGSEDISLRQVGDEYRVDSRALAQQLGNKHQSVRELLTNYADDFRELGLLRFQTGVIDGRGQPERYAMLNEDQAYLLLTYSRNTPRVRDLKVRLVKSFRAARQSQDIARTEYLPTYHALHDQIRTLEGESSARFLHMNMNRLINLTTGIKSGRRKAAGLPERSMLVTAQFLASQAIKGAVDRKTAYARAKVALERFGTSLIEGSQDAV